MQVLGFRGHSIQRKQAQLFQILAYTGNYTAARKTGGSYSSIIAS